jgi:hypothetical protein
MAGSSTAGLGAVATPSSYGSVVNNGQLIGVQTSSGYFPKNYGGGLTAVPALSPVTIPPSVGYGLNATGPNGGNPATNVRNSTSTTASPSNRGSYKGGFIGSPAAWCVGMIVFGALWLRYVHWRTPHPAKEQHED